MNVTSNATVHLEHDVKIVGYETVTLKAVHNAITLIASSDAHCGCLGGDTNSTSNIGYNSESNVTADAGSVIRTALLDVEALQLLTNWSRPTDSDGAAFDGGGSHGGTNENARRVIDWHATVFLHAADPQLVVDANGTIVKLFAVTVKDDLGNTYGLGDTIPVGRIIEVQDITNTGGAQAIFFANIPASLAGGSPPAGIITGTDGKFVAQNTFDFVKLYNSSSRTMVVHAINVVNLTNVAATVSGEGAEQRRVPVHDRPADLPADRGRHRELPRLGQRHGAAHHRRPHLQPDRLDAHRQPARRHPRRPRQPAGRHQHAGDPGRQRHHRHPDQGACSACGSRSR